ncbi:MAG: orotidine-5'-phosphate decarboxylase [Abditibacteriota bacterium]|nr:orotidine-5'-phosphate decarboxylase [Abditibacteriota bacterium]
MKNKIIIPLDVNTTEQAVRLVTELKDHVGAFKIGLEVLNNCGFGIFDAVKEAGADKIFYDCKFLDIPNTVAGASRGAAARNVWMFNVHALGGRIMMEAAKKAAYEEADRLGIPRPLVIAVTILTSIDKAILNSELGMEGEPAEAVVRLALLAREAGLDGVVASPMEITHIRKACGNDFLIVTPGVRPAGSETGDQKRVMTPADAIKAGADYLVIGRPITRAASPAEAAIRIAKEM